MKHRLPKSRGLIRILGLQFIRIGEEWQKKLKFQKSVTFWPTMYMLLSFINA